MQNLSLAVTRQISLNILGPKFHLDVTKGTQNVLAGMFGLVIGTALIVSLTSASYDFMICAVLSFFHSIPDLTYGAYLERLPKRS